MPFACIFVPDFPVEAIVRAEPELRSQAVVVLSGKAPLEKVCALNERARRMGLEIGMTKTQLEACTGVAMRARSPLQEAAAHAALLDCAQSFSPQVEDTAADTVVLDVAGLEPLFGALPKIARDVARRASELGLETNVAVAPNPDAAALAARGFPGVTVIASGMEAERLGELPVSVLWDGLSPHLSPHEKGEKDEDDAERFLNTFQRWGVRNLRALAALPGIPLSERLGQNGLRLQQLARGSSSRTLKLVQPPLLFEEAIELEYPVVLLEPLAFALNRILEQLCARLSSRALATQELRLRLELETDLCPEDSAAPAPALPRCFTRTLRLPVPMLDAKVFLKLLQLDLKAHPPGAPILKIHLAAEPSRPRAAQAGLFVPAFPEPEKLELTLARISGIVGEGRAGTAGLLDTHRPEAFRIEHFAPQEQPIPPLGEPRGNRGNATAHSSPITALRLFRPPLYAEVTLREGKPVRLLCPKRKDIAGEIVWMAGPWRSSGDWWEQDGWARDEWDIAMNRENSFVLYRLVHDLLSGRWMVEGAYD